MSQAASQVTPQQRVSPSRNRDFAWDDFDSAWYYRRNYLHLRWDDREIIEQVRDFFTEAYRRGRLGTSLSGVDVGAGANLYPSLLMLPFCRAIDLLDFSESNLAWLRRQIRGYSNSWDPFWDVLTESAPYKAHKNPRANLREVAQAEKGDIFRLPSTRWDVGTMFFGAESLTSDPEEFGRAVKGFVLALKPYAPFAAAFMRDSKGYPVGNGWFPAIAIDEDYLTRCLASETMELRLHTVAWGERLRSGYDGMILATGYRSGS